MKIYSTLILSLLFGVHCLAQEAVQVKKVPKFSISGGIGFGFRTAELNPELTGVMKTHEKGLASGSSFYIMPRYQFNESYSLGLIYRQFGSTNSSENLGLELFGVTYYSVDEDRRISYIGPTLNYHVMENQAEFNILMSIGYIGFTSDAVFNTSVNPNVPTKTTGGSIGVEMGLEYLWRIAPNLYGGVSMGYTFGSLSKVKVEVLGQTTTQKLEDDERESLEFISLNPVLRLYL